MKIVIIAIPRCNIGIRCTNVWPLTTVKSAISFAKLRAFGDISSTTSYLWLQLAESSTRFALTYETVNWLVYSSLTSSMSLDESCLELQLSTESPSNSQASKPVSGSWSITLKKLTSPPLRLNSLTIHSVWFRSNPSTELRPCHAFSLLRR
jgi:hypothetical protein